MSGPILEGKTALVTAGGSGMGRRSCVRMAEEGAFVIVTDLDDAAAEQTVAEISSAGGRAEARTLDVGDLAQIEAIGTAVSDEHGALHVLFNHAGLPAPPGLEITAEQWTRSTDINMRGAFFMTTHLYPALKQAGGASIIYTASAAGLIGSQFSPLYSLTKGGIVNYMRSIAMRLAPDRIRSNAICPGPVDTPMLPGFFAPAASDDDTETRRQALMASIPLGRLGTPDDIAEAAVFLASDRASYITGVALPIEGGLLAS